MTWMGITEEDLGGSIENNGNSKSAGHDSLPNCCIKKLPAMHRINATAFNRAIDKPPLISE